jgi:hypothetical protein
VPAARLVRLTTPLPLPLPPPPAPQVLLNTALLGPTQMVEFYVQAWPWLPVLTPLFDAFDELRASQAGGAGGAAVPGPAPPAGGAARR